MNILTDETRNLIDAASGGFFRAATAPASPPRRAAIDLQWFAAEDEGRTESPTEATLRREREKGRVPKSADLPGAAILFALSVFMFFFGGRILSRCEGIVRYFFSLCGQSDVSQAIYGRRALSGYAVCVLPFFAIGAVVGVVANVAQTRGLVISVEPVRPKLSNVAPNFPRFFRKTVFSAAGAFNVAKTILKVAVISVISYLTIEGDKNKLVNMCGQSSAASLELVGKTASKLLFFASAFLMVMALVDFLVQRWQFTESHKMKRADVKEEMKEQEGDPQVKAWLMERMRRLMSQNLQKSVSTADVVVTNPTHFACALEFDAAVMDAPTLTAKGADLMAQKIKEVARENDVPIVENKPLARSLYANVEIGEQIPEEYFQVMALVFAEVSRINAAKTRRWSSS